MTETFGWLTKRKAHSKLGSGCTRNFWTSTIPVLCHDKVSFQLGFMAGLKRKLGEESPRELYSNKSRTRTSVEARVDPTYGQRSALPGLDPQTIDDGDEDGLNYDDDGMDALIYLRAVRLVALLCYFCLITATCTGRSSILSITADAKCS